MAMPATQLTAVFNEAIMPEHLSHLAILLKLDINRQFTILNSESPTTVAMDRRLLAWFTLYP
jgi:hypothetical protein